MNCEEFKALVRDAFGFLKYSGFEETPLEAESICVRYTRDQFVLEIKWEDWGTFIYAYVEREDRDGRVTLNDYIGRLLPAHYRQIEPGYFPKGFAREDMIRYLAKSLEAMFDDFWANREALWDELIARAKEEEDE